MKYLKSFDACNSEISKKCLENFWDYLRIHPGPGQTIPELKDAKVMVIVDAT